MGPHVIPLDPNIIIAILSAAIAAASFFIGRQTAAKSRGQEWGELRSDITYIKCSIGKLEENSEKLEASHEQSRAELRAYVDTRFREHMKDFHTKKGE